VTDKALWLRNNPKIDTMNASRDNSNTPQTLAPEDGRQEFPRDNTGSSKHPYISYQPVTSPGGDKSINKAFDLLFQEVMTGKKQT
jgi:hypothetical protein